MATHSSFTDTKPYKKACGVPLLPIRTKLDGPAPKLSEPGDDIIDEVIKSFRINVLFKNYDVASEADKLLIYVTVFLCQCLKKIEGKTNADEARRILWEFVKAPSARPGQPQFFLGGLISKPEDPREIDVFALYTAQLKEEAMNRLLDILFIGKAPAPEYRFWMAYGKKTFMKMVYN
eukprot:TRINITY_DN2184_c0_g4_i3.p1 TRINITY_DN2184_c0_g4~~TRINITY_DN2184_c0_g4_i3.p1  ORF type:complete len:177 (-),score=48.55 TRINITY_DN2184_c0_g4_i3:470-1000(-)